MPKEQALGQHFVSLSVSGKQRLMRLSDVREVVSLMALADTDRRGSYRGVANVRGEMISVFDLAGPSGRLSPSRVVVLVRGRDETLGLLVDDVVDVLEVEENRIAEKPIGGGLTRTVVRLEDEVFQVMEPDDVLRDLG